MKSGQPTHCLRTVVLLRVLRAMLQQYKRPPLNRYFLTRQPGFSLLLSVFGGIHYDVPFEVTKFGRQDKGFPFRRGLHNHNEAVIHNGTAAGILQINQAAVQENS